MSIEILPDDPSPEPDVGGARDGGSGATGEHKPGGRETWRRVIFTLGVLAVYRLGTYVPLPGIDATVVQEILARQVVGPLTVFDRFAGGALGRMSIFALGIVPYIAATLVMLFARIAFHNLRSIQWRISAGRVRLNQYRRCLALFLCGVQAYGIAVGLEGIRGYDGPAVMDPGPVFRVTLMLSLVAGTAFLIWLAEQISDRGVGDGILLIVFAGIIAEVPSAFAGILFLVHSGAMSMILFLGVVLCAVMTLAAAIFLQRSWRRIVVEYPERRAGGRLLPGAAPHLPFLLNASGAASPLFAVMLLAHLPGLPQAIFFAVFIILIVVFALIVATTLEPIPETAENLRQHGAFVPGVRPGGATADYLGFVRRRTTVAGAAFLAVICVVPDIVLAQAGLSSRFFGAGVVIVVVAIMDAAGSAHSQFLLQQVRDGGHPPFSN